MDAISRLWCFYWALVRTSELDQLLNYPFLAYTSSSAVDGRFDTDTLEIRDMFGDMWFELAENREKWGCMSMTWLIPACLDEGLTSH